MITTCTGCGKAGVASDDLSKEPRCRACMPPGQLPATDDPAAQVATPEQMLAYLFQTTWGLRREVATLKDQLDALDHRVRAAEGRGLP